MNKLQIQQNKNIYAKQMRCVHCVQCVVLLRALRRVSLCCVTVLVCVASCFLFFICYLQAFVNHVPTCVRTDLFLRLIAYSRSCADTETTKQYINMRRFVYRRIFGCRCLSSLSALRHIIVVVRAHTQNVDRAFSLRRTLSQSIWTSD